MDYICVLLGIFFVTAGLVFGFGKGYKHLSAWEEMPEAEKEKINIEPLCRNIGGMITLNGVLFVLKGFCAAFSGTAFTCAIILWMVIAGADVYYISRSKRYKRQ